MESPNNTYEKAPIKTETITGAELMERIYRGESVPQESAFLPIKNMSGFRYFDLTELNNIFNQEKRQFYSLIEAGEELAGLAKLEEKPDAEKTFWIKFVSVHPDYQNQGLASQLVEEIFKFAKKEGITLEGSSYSKEGREKLKQVFERFSKEYSVPFIDADEKI